VNQANCNLVELRLFSKRVVFLTVIRPTFVIVEAFFIQPSSMIFKIIVVFGHICVLVIYYHNIGILYFYFSICSTENRYMLSILYIKMVAGINTFRQTSIVFFYRHSKMNIREFLAVYSFNIDIYVGVTLSFK